MIPSVLATAQLAVRFAAVAPVKVDPNTAPLPFTPAVSAAVQTEAKKKEKLIATAGGYFDLGYEKLIGTFADQIVHGGLRYGQDEVDAFVRDSTIDTHGSGSPFPQSVTGTSIGLEYRHYFPKDQMFAFASTAKILSGFDKDQTDNRFGLIGYTNWLNKKGNVITDVYGELIYEAIVPDTFFDIRFRSGHKFYEDSKHDYWWTYLLAQAWVAGQETSGAENRAEAGVGVAYIFKRLDLSINIEPRVGYSFRGDISPKLYFNPTVIISTGFDFKSK